MMSARPFLEMIDRITFVLLFLPGPALQPRRARAGNCKPRASRGAVPLMKRKPRNRAGRETDPGNKRRRTVSGASRIWSERHARGRRGGEEAPYTQRLAGLFR